MVQYGCLVVNQGLKFFKIWIRFVECEVWIGSGPSHLSGYVMDNSLGVQYIDRILSGLFSRCCPIFCRLILCLHQSGQNLARTHSSFHSSSELHKWLCSSWSGTDTFFPLWDCQEEDAGTEHSCYQHFVIGARGGRDWGKTSWGIMSATLFLLAVGYRDSGFGFLGFFAHLWVFVCLLFCF